MQPQRRSKEWVVTQAHNLLSRRIVYSIYYNSTLILPDIRGKRGEDWLRLWLLVRLDGGREQETLFYYSDTDELYIHDNK